MDEGLIQIQAMAARIACLQMTAQHLKALHDSVEHASCRPTRSQWDRKAAAHADSFRLLQIWQMPRTWHRCSAAAPNPYTT
jgi:hypothetical protein